MKRIPLITITPTIKVQILCSLERSRHWLIYQRPALLFIEVYFISNPSLV
jgi:hypothetical protein